MKLCVAWFIRTMRRGMGDVPVVFRRGTVVATLVVVGLAIYWLLYRLLAVTLGFSLDFTAVMLATFAVVIVANLVYLLRRPILTAVSYIFEGRNYNYRRRLSEYAEGIQNIFSLKEQGGGLLSLVTKATGCVNTGLLFPEDGGENFSAQLLEPAIDNPLTGLRLEAGSPVLNYLAHEQKLLTRERAADIPEVRNYLTEEARNRGREIALFQPLISRGRLIAVLVLGRKQSGHYLLDELTLLKDVAGRVAVAMEKEYLREQLYAQEQKLAIINRSAAIITSSLNIQESFTSFIMELSKLDNIDWSAIVLIQDKSLGFMATWPDAEPIWQPGERLPLAGSLTELCASTKQPVFVPDIVSESREINLHRFTDCGLQSILCLPLIVRGEVTGSLHLGSRRAFAYSQRHIELLNQLASQIAMSVENARLYARAQEMARIDGLTGLLNRRSFDEMLTNEIGRCSRYGGIFSIIILDLDSLKVYNDNYGHLAGDKLIRQIGMSIKSSIRVVDYAFRYGGDEFAILLPQTPINAANQVAERIREEVLEVTHHEDTMDFGAVPVSASLGLAAWPTDGVGRNEIIAAADEALYQAKRKGGNMVCSASVSLERFHDSLALLGGSKDERAALGTIYALWAKVDARTHDSHSEKVSECASALGRAINLDVKDIARLETCALLHDIGKIVINDEILNKRGELSSQEWEIIKTHPQLGANIASVCQLGKCVPGILHHHERFDGSGYPDGLKATDIPIEARILAIADAFAAMTSERSYSNCLSREKALGEIKLGAGKQFDPHLAEVFISLFAEENDQTREKLGITRANNLTKGESHG